MSKSQTTTKPRKTAAVYSRYSTTKQKLTSIDDQNAAAERVAKRHDLTITHWFADRAKSGTSQLGRDGYSDLKAAIKQRAFNVLIVEDIDRLGRDVEDSAHIRKLLAYSDIKLLNHSGEMSEIEADIKQVVAAQFVRDLVVKIKRGLDGRAEKGLRPGAVTYGYDRVQVAPATFGADGALLAPAVYDPGIRVKHEQEAEIVRRIFREYDAGISPRQIAQGLTRDGIPAPSGAARWSHQTLIGGTYGRGMLGNRLYIGESVWNSHTTVKNPYTLKDAKRPVDASEHIVRQVPHLRIIDQRLWDRVQARREQRAQQKFGPTGKMVRKVVDRSPHLLAGILQCGACGGSMKFKGKNRKGHARVVCSAAYNYGSCKHSKDYDVEVLKELAVVNLKAMLSDQNNMKQAAQEAARHFQVIAKRNNGERAELTRKRNEIAVKIERCARTIVQVGDSPTMSKMLQELEAEHAGLQARLECVSGTNLALHPNMIPKYLEAVHRLATLLNEGEETAELRTSFRNMIDRIEVKPTGKRMPYVIEAFGRQSVMLGMDFFPTSRSKEELLETEGLSRGSNGNTLLSGLPIEPHGNVISLGHWKQATTPLGRRSRAA